MCSRSTHRYCTAPGWACSPAASRSRIMNAVVGGSTHLSNSTGAALRITTSANSRNTKLNIRLTKDRADEESDMDHESATCQEQKPAAPETSVIQLLVDCT